MFNKKYIQLLERENERLLEQNSKLLKENITNIELIKNYSVAILKKLGIYESKSEPEIVYTIDAIALANKIANKCELRKKCGGGSCGKYYQVPEQFIKDMLKRFKQ